jgi:hypothetical protein
MVSTTARVIGATMSEYGPYGPYPPHPSRQSPPPWTGQPPVGVRYARNLIYLSIGLSLVRWAQVVFLEGPPDLPEPLDDHISDELVTVLDAIAALIFTVSFAAIRVVAAIFVMQAANWARILVAGLCALDVFGVLWDVASNSLILEHGERLDNDIIVLDVVSAVVVGVATALLWTRESSCYFKSSG